MRPDSNRQATIVLRIVLAALGVFGLMAVLVLAKQTEPFDTAVFLAMRDPEDISNAWGPAWFEEAAAEFTALGGYTILVTIALICIIGLVLAREGAAALFLAVTLLSGSILSSVLKVFFARPRPDLVDHMDKTFTASFPSGHSMFGMLAWLTLAAIVTRFVPTPRFRVFTVTTALLIGILIGVSRIYLGVHWPSDVIAGWSLGIAWSGTCWLVAHSINRARRRGESVLPGNPRL
ncbi:MAG: phosphatase PAP2 family protein [Alphaproteobacteria bacterium]|nr:phosphatase PAP2 family protein [Alphaproteobacteria bacterium]